MILTHVVMEAPLIGLSWTLAMVAVTFIVLYLILKKYLFEKVHNFMEARSQKIVDAFENAEAAGRVADERLKVYNGKLESIDRERRETLTAAKLKADEHAKTILQDAEGKAAELLKNAREEIEREKARAMEDMREQVAMLAVYAAERIIEKQLDMTAQHAIVDSVLEEAGRAEWRI